LLHLRDQVFFLPLIFNHDETWIGTTKLPGIVQLLITKLAQRNDLVESDLARQDGKGMEDDASPNPMWATSSVSPLPKMRRSKHGLALDEAHRDFLGPYDLVFALGIS